MKKNNRLATVPKRHKPTIINIQASKQWDKPEYYEIKNPRGYIQFGSDNLLPSYFVELAKGSPTHNAILKTKANLIAGNGIDETGLSQGALDLLKNINGTEDLNEIVAKVAMDEIYSGTGALLVTWSEDRQTIARVSYMNGLIVRYAADDAYNNLPPVNHFFTSDDWSKLNQYPPIFYQEFSTLYKEKEGEYAGNPNQIILINEHEPSATNNYYTLPDWFPAENWLLIEKEIAQFHLTNLKDSFTPNLHINMPTGVPSDEEREEEVKRLRKQFEGSKGDKTLITFSTDVNDVPTIEAIDSANSDEMFQTLIEQVRENILIANRVVDPKLHGVIISSQLGSGDGDILNSLALFQSQYINPKQVLIEKALSKIAKANGITDEIKLAKYTIELPVTKPASAELLAILATPYPYIVKLAILKAYGYDEAEAISFLEGNKNNPLPDANSQNM